MLKLVNSCFLVGQPLEMHSTHELLHMTDDYLTTPSDYFRLRRCSTGIRNSLRMCLRGVKAPFSGRLPPVLVSKYRDLVPL
jgi:hypothetical protein